MKSQRIEKKRSNAQSEYMPAPFDLVMTVMAQACLLVITVVHRIDSIGYF